jgi:uncharacterized membrane protein
MSVRTYNLWKIVIVIIVAILVGWGVNANNAFIPVPTVLVGGGVLLFLRSRVKEITTDERTFNIAGRAARFTLSFFVILAAAAGATLLAIGGGTTPALETVGFTLAYSICTLLILYFISYIYYNRKYGGKE